MSKNAVELIKQVFFEYCKKKKYECKEIKEESCIRLNISNLKEVSIVKLFYTKTILIQGKENILKKELEDLKKDIEADPKKYLGMLLI